MSKLFKTSASSSQTSSIDPQQRAMMNDAYSRMAGVANRPYQAYQGDTVADWNDLQTEGMNSMVSAARNNVGGATLNNAIQGTQNAMNYRPMMVGATQVTPGMTVQNQNVSAQNVSADPMQAAQLGAGEIGQFMDPYIDTVAGGMMDKMGRQLAQTQMGNSAAATAAGAYGGSRHGVVEAETNRGFFDTLSQNLGQLYSQGFGQAAQLAQSNVANRQQAGLANQNANLQAGMANQGANLQAGMANQGANLQAQTTNLNANMQGQLANQSANLQAGLANQNAHQGAANLGLSAAGQMAGLSNQQRENAFQNAAAIQGQGNAWQAYQQQNLDDAAGRWNDEWNYPIQMAGMLGNYVNGMPSMGGTTSGTTTQRPSTMNMIGAGASALGGLMAFSDENVKSGRKKASGKKALHAIEKTPVETWRYDPAKGGPGDGETHIGPMAQRVKKNLGIGSGRAFPMLDVMGTNMAATQELAKKVRKLEAKDVKVKRVVKKGSK